MKMDKELELKFQQLIQEKTIGNPATTEITQAASSKKRAQPVPNAVVARTATSSANSITVNPYATARRHAAPQRQARAPRARRSGGMNENLLKVYNSVRGDGIQAMQKLHKSLTERPRYY